MGDHPNPDYSLLGDEHVRRYRETDGEVGYEWNGAPTLLLTTTGRRSGEARTAPLIFGRDGDDLPHGRVGGWLAEAPGVVPQPAGRPACLGPGARPTASTFAPARPRRTRSRDCGGS